MLSITHLGSLLRTNAGTDAGTDINIDQIRRTTAEAVQCGAQPGPKTGVSWECRSGSWKARRIKPYAWSPGTSFSPTPRCHDVALSRIVSDSYCIKAGLPRPGTDVPQDIIQISVQSLPPGPLVIPEVVVPTTDQIYAEAPPPIYKRAWFWLVIAAAAGGGTYAVLRRR